MSTTVGGGDPTACTCSPTLATSAAALASRVKAADDMPRQCLLEGTSEVLAQLELRIYDARQESSVIDIPRKTPAGSEESESVGSLPTRDTRRCASCSREGMPKGGVTARWSGWADFLAPWASRLAPVSAAVSSAFSSHPASAPSALRLPCAAEFRPASGRVRPSLCTRHSHDRAGSRGLVHSCRMCA
jgi:hypothetical protein